jgi:hypothetical protein
MKDSSSKPNLLSFDAIQSATRCQQEWANMGGNECVRFCNTCHKNVYNVGAMKPEEAEELILRHERGARIRLHQRADGTLLTSDCPVGIAQSRGPNDWFSNMLLVTLVAILGVVGVRIFQTNQDKSNFNRPSICISTMIIGPAFQKAEEQ